MKEEVFKLVNEIRIALGATELKELPKGTKVSASDCPIRNALSDIGCTSFYAYIVFNEEDKRINILHKNLGIEKPMPFALSSPDILMEFARAFDAGIYPELIK